MIKIGTRSSELALWQANTVARQLEKLGHSTKIIKIDSIGDQVLDKPLYELGVTGVFTKSLDIALINGDIDIAVHSLKDVPTKLPEGVIQAAVLKRGNYNDVLILKKDENFFENEIATNHSNWKFAKKSTMASSLSKAQHNRASWKCKHTPTETKRQSLGWSNFRLSWFVKNKTITK